MQQTDENLPDESPPIFSSWKYLYAIVLILHTIIIAIFYFFTQNHSNWLIDLIISINSIVVAIELIEIIKSIELIK